MTSPRQLIGQIIAPAPRDPDAAPTPLSATAREPLEALLARVISAPAGRIRRRADREPPLHAEPIPDAAAVPLEAPLQP